MPKSSKKPAKTRRPVRRITGIAGGRDAIPFTRDEASAEWTPEEFFQSFRASGRARLEQSPFVIVWGEGDEPVWHTLHGRVRLRPALVPKIVALLKQFNAQPAEDQQEAKLHRTLAALVESYYAKSGHDAAELTMALKLAPALAKTLRDDGDYISHEMEIVQNVGKHLQPVRTQVLQPPESGAMPIRSATASEPATATANVVGMPDKKKTRLHQAQLETTRRKRAITPKRADKKAMAAYLSPKDAEDIVFIAAAKDEGVTDYMSIVLSAHVAKNAHLVPIGKKKLEQQRKLKQPKRYRTRRMELEERIFELEGRTPGSKPSPR